MRSSLHRSTRPATPAVRPSVPAIAAALASFTFVPATSFAQAADSGTAQLAPVVVTSTRTPQAITEALPHTTVVTQQDIVNSQAPDLRTLLRSQAGVEFSTNGGMGSNTTLFMRGANSNQTLILIDGVRVSSASRSVARRCARCP